METVRDGEIVTLTVKASVASRLVKDLNLEIDVNLAQKVRK
jgi:hypothetical protein